ncbi:MAG TPA: multicopper oxidase domain-containing protein, partial [Gemmatimonadaceae bacterium]
MTESDPVVEEVAAATVDTAAEPPTFQASSTRRAFLHRASLLSLAIPGIGAALSACGLDDKPQHGDTAVVAAQAPPNGKLPRNPDSKLDSSLHAGASATTLTGGSAQGVVFKRFDPTLPPLSTNRTLRLHWKARAVPIRVSDDTVVAGWTFEGDTPGPLVHCRVGDTVEFTLTNEADMPHSMDFHAAQINPQVAFRSAAKGESVSF